MIRYLQDVPGLEPLESIAKKFGVVITARGGFARRLYTHEVLGPALRIPDLFELTPFSSGIGLTHSGATEQNDAILGAIHGAVPMAECFRWELRSAEQENHFDRAKGNEALIPVSTVRLSTAAGFDDPWGARRDIGVGKYRFVRNPGYTESPLYRLGQDLEVFSAIRYLRALFERGDDRVLVDQPGFDAVKSVFEESQTWQTLGKLQESAFLRTRLHYALKGLGALTWSKTARDIVARFRLRAFAEFIDGPQPQTTRGYQKTFPTLVEVRADPEQGSQVPRGKFRDDLDLDNYFAITASEHVAGDLFRLPPVVTFSPTIGKDPVLDVLRREPGKPSHLAEGIDVLLTSAWVQILPGRGRDAACSTAPRNEFFHLAIIDRPGPDSPRPVPDEDVSMLVMLAGETLGAPGIAAPLVVCSSRPYQGGVTPNDRIQLIRVACGNLFDQLPTGDQEPPVHLAIAMVSRRVKESPPEAQPSVRYLPLVAGDASKAVSHP
jgi:hypothetical protein